MSKFRIKTVEVEAALFDGKLVGEPSLTDPRKVEPLTCPDWFPAVMEEKAPNDFGWKDGDICRLGDKIYIGRQDGDTVRTVTVHPGDWFVRRPSGQLTHLSGEQFAATYEPEPFALSQSGGVGARYGVSGPGDGIAGVQAWFTEETEAERYADDWAPPCEVWDLVKGKLVQ